MIENKELKERFIEWVCKKFDMGAEDNLIRDFMLINYSENFRIA